MVEIVLPAPYLQSSHHAGTAGALAFALAEMLAFGRDYAAQVVRNSRALAAALDDRGVPLLGGVATSDSHQVVIDLGGLASPAAVELCASLEAANVFADVVVRLGTQQPARLGMGEGEMVEIADIVAGTMKQGATDALRERSRTLAMSYRTLSFAFDLGEPDDAYRQLGPGVPSLSP
jgi:glycine hydroxymethyltransferase